MLKIVIIAGLILLIAAPIYHLLKRRLAKICRELEYNETQDLLIRLTEHEQDEQNLKTECDLAEEAAREQLKQAKTIQNKLQGKKS